MGKGSSPRNCFSQAFRDNYDAIYRKPAGIVVGADGRCQCSCADACPLGRAGSELRCHESELYAAGIHTVSRNLS